MSLKPQSTARGHFADALALLNHIEFTKRETDILAGLIGGKSPKKIAALLNIAPKTVSTHIYNVMEKLNIHARDQVVELLQHSQLFPHLKKHFCALVMEAEFKIQFKKIATMRRPKISCFINNQEQQVIQNLLKSLKAAGITAQPYNPSSPKKGIVLIGLNENREITIQRGSQITVVDSTDVFAPFDVLKAVLNIGAVDELVSNLKDEWRESSFENCKVDLKELKKRNNLTALGGILMQPKHIKMLVGLLALLTAGGVIVGKSWGKKELQGYTPIISIRSNLSIPTTSWLLDRAPILAQIRSKFANNDPIKTVVLAGMGGMGKTVVARQYIKSLSCPVVWEINAQTPQTLIDSFSNLAYALSSNTEEKQELDRIKQIEKDTEYRDRLVLFVQHKLKERKEWALLFDNVDSFDSIRPFFPGDAKAWGTGKVLITTRNHHMALSSYGYINTDNMIFIAPLEPEEQFSLFTQILYGKKALNLTAEQRRDIDGFLKQLSPFPLDISSAAYHIKNSGISYQEYLDHMHNSDRNFGKVKSILMQEMLHYAQTRYNIITATVTQFLKINPEFESLLFAISVLDSQKIPQVLLEKITNKNLLNQFLVNVRKYAFMTSKTESDHMETLSIHRTIQEITRLYLKSEIPQERRAVYLENILKATEAYCKPMVDTINLAGMRQFMPHLQALSAYNKEENGLFTGGIDLILGSMYCQFGDLITALQHLNPAIKNLTTADSHSAAYPRFLRALTYAGMTEKENGNYPVALKLLEQSVELRDKDQKTDSLELALTLRHLAHTCSYLGKAEKAFAYINRGISIYSKEAPQNPNLPMALSDLASIHHASTGAFEKAIEYRKKALDLLSQTYGIENFKTIFVQGLLGMDCERGGYYKDMIAAFKKSYDIYVSKYDYNLHHISWITGNLGNAYRALGLYEQAKPLLLKAYDLEKEYYGEHHTHTDLSRFHVGRFYLDTEDYVQAQNLLEHSLKGHIKHFGESHYKAAWISRYLARVYVAIRRYQDAQKLFEKSLAFYEKQYGKDQVDYAMVLGDFGYLHLVQKDYDKAEELINQAFTTLEKHHHAEAYKCLEYLGDLYTAKNNTIKAREFYQKAIKIAQDAFPKESAHIARLKKKIQI